MHVCMYIWRSTLLHVALYTQAVKWMNERKRIDCLFNSKYTCIPLCVIWVYMPTNCYSLFITFYTLCQFFFQHCFGKARQIYFYVATVVYSGDTMSSASKSCSFFFCLYLAQVGSKSVGVLYTVKITFKMVCIAPWI